MVKINGNHFILHMTKGSQEFLNTYPELSYLKWVKRQYIRRTILANIKVVELVP